MNVFIMGLKMWSLESLKDMDPYDFELLIGELFEAMGYQTHVTPRSRDFGVDILIRLEHLGLSHSWIVQAKKYNGNVGVRDIREYGSLRMRDNVDGVIVVTTGYFTKDALDEAYRYNVKLISGDILAGMLNRYLRKHVSHEKEPGPEKDNADLLLHDNENIIIRKPVTINGNRFELILSSKNLFLKEIGFLSKKAMLKHKISISKLIGALREKNGILIFIGGENIRTCLIKGDEKILEALDQAISSSLKLPEKLRKYSKHGRREMVLTNKRLYSADGKNTWQIAVFRIGGVEIAKSWIGRSSKIKLFITGGIMEQKELIVDDPASWKSEIESAVRSSRVF